MIDVVEFGKARVLYRANQQLSRTEFERKRLDRFREFAGFVRNHSPYYRRIMEDRKIEPAKCLPQDFPVLTKTELIRNFNDIITVRDLTYQDVAEFLHSPSGPEKLLRDRYIVIHTSGTSGEVGFFLYDRQAWARVVATLSRAKGFNFLTTKKTKLAFMGATQGHFAGVTSACMVRQFPLTLFYELRTYEINRPLRDALNDMNVYQPHVVVGYGSALKALAEKVLEGELKIRPQLVTNSGEPILAADREVIERAFGKCIRNLYTCSEHMFMGLKESWNNSMCLFEDDLIFEINSDHTLVTNIFNRLLPLIRYKMSDILTPLDLPEHQPYQAIAEIAGRVESQAKFRNRHGSTDGISPHTINEVIIPHVRKFQMRLKGAESFEFAVVLEPGIADGQRRHALEVGRNVLSAILVEKEMDNVRFDITIVDEIPVDAKTGKFRLILHAAAAAAQ